ncbi:hypothetical protein [Litoribacter populi]|uniref:hypothetical protein n=1 Tax=Litoribacter populi TaxID=2598460 RepID=UPI0011813D24|nr:hypothetical protein [Litoribacter populi]
MSNHKIYVPNTNWDLIKIGPQLLHLQKSIKAWSPDIEKINFKGLKFSPPLLAVYYASLIQESTIKINFEGLSGYLETLKFPYGLLPDDTNNWKNTLNAFSSKTYLPIIKFSNKTTKEETILREMLLSHALKIIGSITQIPSNYYSAINYLLSELTDNIVEHSRHDFGYFSFQYYRENGLMDICIADKGIGLLGSYQKYEGERDFSQISNHLLAVDSAIKGNSTKPIPEKRGYGIATSRRMLIEGLGGHFVYLTGNALLINEEMSNFGEYFQGTIALIRIPVKSFSKDFNWYKFVE